MIRLWLHHTVIREKKKKTGGKRARGPFFSARWEHSIICVFVLLVLIVSSFTSFKRNFTLQFTLWISECITNRQQQRLKTNPCTSCLSGKSQRDIAVFVYCPFTRIRHATNNKKDALACSIAHTLEYNTQQPIHIWILQRCIPKVALSATLQKKRVEKIEGKKMNSWTKKKHWIQNNSFRSVFIQFHFFGPMDHKKCMLYTIILSDIFFSVHWS